VLDFQAASASAPEVGRIIGDFWRASTANFRKHAIEAKKVA
jgi:hypothetical protein